ncbi:MAG TPA: hypothetical protein VHA52_02415 [Candidatus Babeliaceae bacterium]|nr:hypothetical protein [Candidatus Babeliaceae bacterium]
MKYICLSFLTVAALGFITSAEARFTERHHHEAKKSQAEHHKTRIEHWKAVIDALKSAGHKADSEVIKWAEHNLHRAERFASHFGHHARHPHAKHHEATEHTTQQHEVA